MERGYIKLWRKLIDSRIFQNEGLLKLWIWCLLRANHKKAWMPVTVGKGQTVIELQPGQFVFGRDSAAKALRANPSTVWKRLKRIESMQKLNIQSNRQFSIITIINWDVYNSTIKKSNRQSNRQVTGKEQASNTDKNDKNEKKAISCPFGPIKDHFNSILGEQLPQVKKLTDERKTVLRQRWSEAFETSNGHKSDSLEFWIEYFKYIRASDFLMGRKSDWQANFDFIIKKSKFYKIIEGQYHN